MYNSLRKNGFDMKRWYMFNGKILYTFALSLIFILSAVFLNLYFKNQIKTSNIIPEIQSEILFKQKDLENHLEKIKRELMKNDNEIIQYSSKSMNLCNKDEELLLIYQNDSLKYWSDNNVPVPEFYDDRVFGKSFNHFENGWFIIERLNYKNKKLVGLQLIKHDYKYQNEHLRNNFQNDFKLSSEIKLSLSEGKNNVYGSDEEFLFSLQLPGSITIGNRNIFVLFLLYLPGFLFFISFLHHAHKEFTKTFRRKWVFILTFLIDLIILRIVLVYFRIPRILFESELFSPLNYASSTMLASLGHLMIDTILLLMFAYVVNSSLKPEINISRVKPVFRSVLTIIIFLLIVLLYKGLISVFSSIIIHSSIPLDLNRILDFSFFSVISYLIIVSLVFSFFFLSSKLLYLINILTNSLKKQRIALLVSLTLVIVLTYLTTYDRLLNTIVLLIYIISFGIFINRKEEFVRFTTVVFYLFLFAFFATNILQKNLKIKEKETRKLLAVKLSAEQDPVAEFLFNSIENKIYSDNVLKKKIIAAAYNDSLEAETIEYLQKNYFNEYWSKYDLQVTICAQNKLLDIEFEDVIMNCYEYFDKKISDMGVKTANPGLFYMDYGFGDDSYLAVLKFEKNNDTLVRAYIETVSKIVPKGLGYPELLIDSEVDEKSNTSEYSYAIYKENDLFKLVGKYPYSRNAGDYDNGIAGFRFFDENNFNHLFYSPDPKTSIVVSRADNDFLDIFAPFSYFFIFFGIYVLFFLIIIHFPFRNAFVQLNFRNQIQFSIVSTIIASFLLIGLTTLTYIISLNNDKNTDILTEKAHSVLIELEHKLAEEDELTPEIQEYLSVLLIKFSNVFFSDINLYDLNGKLLASSRPQIFEEGLISDRMNTEAFRAMSYERKSNFIQEERICNYEYLSAYVPFRNYDNKLIAYLNLPYFAKQDELRDEISTFLVAFINIYVILIAIAVLIALLVSNYISRPLKLIKDKMRSLQFGKSNEKIRWERKDEIGNLISEYNRMIDELAESAGLLAKSERESAWREMAKQVAHEIKNPLTPMKLNVQHLKKAWDEKAEDWDERLAKFSDTLIEQIESLSDIASEFSDFANMPKAKNEKTDLSEVIRNSIELHNNYDNISLDYLADEEMSYFILADKKQILRVFNNLIKNSIQAIGNKKDGQVSIKIETLDKTYIIKVIDNGSGIAKDQGDKIFIPSFTTKSSGMGLGLSMVRSIVISSGGSIRYTSEPGKGTTFYITLPKFE
jgi:two-component system nitrogen regulation sensor histidine kinase NtrY